jgi:hypothetical protein
LTQARWARCLGWFTANCGAIISSMKGTGLSRLRSSGWWLPRGVAWTVVVALMINIATVMPLMLRMAVADTDKAMMSGSPCPMPGMGDKSMGEKSPVPGVPPCDHQHCLICQGGIGAAVLGSAVPPIAAPLTIRVGLLEKRPVFVAQPFRTSYASRAPPPAI